jgi:hypothetical protein
MPLEVRELEEIEGFRAVLINLSDGLTDSTIDPGLVAAYLREMLNTSGDLKSSRSPNSLHMKMLNIVFADVARFQYRTVLSKRSELLLASFRGLNNLSWLIQSHKGLRDRLTGGGGALSNFFNSSDPSAEPTADECRLFADSINEVCGKTEEFFLAADTLPGSRKRLAWFTDLANLTERLGPLPQMGSDAYAYRLRNWLGLGHVYLGEHLFGFISTAKDVCGADLARPTVFDGIDNLWFKHLRAADSYMDDAGRALNLDSLGKPVGPFDGGWEAVTPGPKFSGQFKCVYIGRVIPPATARTGKHDAGKYDEELVLQAILSTTASARSYADVAAELLAKIP